MTTGWEDGHCKNLSGFEGDLSEPDATIWTWRNYLNEIQEEEERKKESEGERLSVQRYTRLERNSWMAWRSKDRVSYLLKIYDLLKDRVTYLLKIRYD
jgi:hypothetical protein